MFTAQTEIWSEKYQQSAAGGSLAPTPPHVHLLLGGKTSVKTVFFHMPSIGHIFLALPLEKLLKA